MNAVVNISLPVEFLKKLNSACDDLGISRSKFLRKSAELLIDDLDNDVTIKYLVKKAGADE